MELLRENLRWNVILSTFGFLLSVGFQVRGDSVKGQSTGSSYFFYQQPDYPRDCYEALISCSSMQNKSGVYLIKPDGYPEPFEVYCDNELLTGGWTVLQRRSMGSIHFNRTWEEFRNGFGFLGTEFWLGNDKIAFLTNQKKYQLRMDIQNSAGQSYYVTYENFKISDDYGEYSLSSIGSYNGTAESYLEWCPVNELFSSDTCERTCDDPEKCIFSTEEEKCVCIGSNKIHQGSCIPDNQCGCFVSENGNIVPNGESYVNSDCTRRSNCTDNVLDVEDDYRCSNDATCMEKDGVRRCYCNDGFEGDGVSCTLAFVPKDCQDIYDANTRIDDVYTIYPDGYPGGIQVYCEMETNGAGWTIFQRRSSASVDFHQDWSRYEDGFGSPSQDHWLGNKYIHAMTHQKTYQLRMDVTDSSSSSYHAIYSTFEISDETDKYRLSLGQYSGTTGTGFYGHNNRQFSTWDDDNDGYSSYNCAQRHTGGWWFLDRSPCAFDVCSTSEVDCEFFIDGSCCASCTFVNLNGDYDGSSRATNILWNNLPGQDCGLVRTEMKIRPV